MRHQSGLLGLWVQIQLQQGFLSLVSVLHCQVQVSVLGCSPIQRNPTECDGVSECDCEALIMRRPWPTWGCCAVKKKSPLIPKDMLPSSNSDIWQLHYFSYQSPIYTVIFSIFMYYHYQILKQVAAVCTVCTVFVNLFYLLSECLRIV